MHLKEIFIYPIKSLAGISIQRGVFDDFGLQWDRRWALIGADGNVITQRTNPELCFFRVSQTEDGFTVTHTQQKEFKEEIPFEPLSKKRIQVPIWSDVCNAFEVSPMISWSFSGVLNMEVKMVFFPADNKRQVDLDYAEEGMLTSFSDGFPLLAISEASLDHLNTKLTGPMTMNRFRPNLVLEGLAPHGEDELGEFTIGESTFKAVKPCSRCVFTTVNPNTGEKGKEPLKTLATYRLQNQKIMFGQNVLLLSGGFIEVGEKLTSNHVC